MLLNYPEKKDKTDLRLVVNIKSRNICFVNALKASESCCMSASGKLSVKEFTIRYLTTHIVNIVELDSYTYSM